MELAARVESVPLPLEPGEHVASAATFTFHSAAITDGGRLLLGTFQQPRYLPGRFLNLVLELEVTPGAESWNNTNTRATRTSSSSGASRVSRC